MIANIKGFLELLGKGFITSVVFFGLVFVIRTIDVWNIEALYEGKELISLLIYHFIGISIVVFQASIYFVYKKLTFYPKVKSVVDYWQWFEVLLLAILLGGSFILEPDQYVLFGAIGVVAVFATFLTVRLKWVVYLDFRQKLQALFLVASIFLMGVYFLQLFIGSDFEGKIPLSISNSLFIYCQFTFFGVYSLFSILILFFNLPTSGVFEKKFEEISRFQLLSETLQKGTDQNEVMELLLESCCAISLADMAWIGYHEPKGAKLVLRNASEAITQKIHSYLIKAGIDPQSQEILVKDLDTVKEKLKILGGQVSLLSIPIRTASSKVGHLVLIKSVKDGFERDIVNVLRMYTQQAAISLENMMLLSEAIEKERYYEEIKISKRVQMSLLPKENLRSNQLEIGHFTRSTGTVGGDFFDYYTTNDKQYWVAIGDVAGKGTAAAFLMAQLKGIFRSLIQVCSGPKNLVVRANYALAYTAERSSFITFSVYLIDTEMRLIRHVRAGHCQAFFYSRSQQSITLLEPKGMGLGIVKDNSFREYIEEEAVPYQTGDILFLYTDGVTEARNHEGKMFGTDGLSAFIRKFKDEKVEEILTEFEKCLYGFAPDTVDDDDVTFMVVRFQ